MDNKTIKESMGIKETIIDCIEEKQLIWHDHVLQKVIIIMIIIVNENVFLNPLSKYLFRFGKLYH